MNLTVPPMIWSGLAFGVSGVIIYQLKSIPLLIYRKVKQKLIYTVRIYQYDELFMVLERFFSDKHSSFYRDVEASLEYTSNSPLDSNGRMIPALGYKQEENTFIIRYNNKRLLISKAKEKLDKVQTIKDIYFRKYAISGILAKATINDLLQEAITYSNKKSEKETVTVRTHNKHGDWLAEKEIMVKSLDKIVLDPTTKCEITSDLDEFLISQDWYLSTSIPYKRGYLFYGPPGTGKTTLALGIARYTGKRLYCLNMNCFEDDSVFVQAFQNFSDNSILLIEDIDKVFSGRENVKEGSKISFSSLLNCLDGALYKHGLITIITTNHIEKLDPALIRTGRVDLKREVPLPCEREISEYLTIFYSKEITITGEFTLTMSDVQDICLHNKKDPDKAVAQLLSHIESEVKVLSISEPSSYPPESYPWRTVITNGMEPASLTP